jgi:hypothetical protein
VATIIQLDFSAVDPLWWARVDLWREWETADTVERPTEDAALRAILRRARILEHRGFMLELSPLHEQAMRLEYQVKMYYPHYLDVAGWVAERLGTGKHQAVNILSEAEMICAAREIIGKPLVFDWQAIPAPRSVEVRNKRGKRAA